MQKLVTPRPGERNTQTSRRKTRRKRPIPDPIDWDRSRLEGLDDGALLEEVLRELETPGTARPALEELERRHGWEQAAAVLALSGPEGLEAAFRQWGYLALPDLVRRAGEEAEAAFGDDPEGRWRAHLGRGEPLDRTTRARMERGLGADFSDVRVHTDPKAASLARRMGARALAFGRHIAFAPGAFQPGTLEGDRLIAHELAHVLQQREGIAQSSAGLSAERAADDKAEQALRVPRRHIPLTLRPSAGTYRHFAATASRGVRPVVQMRRVVSRRSFDPRLDLFQLYVALAPGSSIRSRLAWRRGRIRRILRRLLQGRPSSHRGDQDGDRDGRGQDRDRDGRDQDRDRDGRGQDRDRDGRDQDRGRDGRDQEQDRDRDGRDQEQDRDRDGRGRDGKQPDRSSNDQGGGVKGSRRPATMPEVNIPDVRGVDIDFIAREYAFHEQWAQLPPGEQNQVVNRVKPGGEPGDPGKATIPLEERERLLREATGAGGVQGALDLFQSIAIEVMMGQMGRRLPTKAVGRYIPVVGALFAAWDFGQGLANAFGPKGSFAKDFATLDDPNATEIDKTIARLNIAKTIVGLLSGFLGLAAAVCEVIAVLTSWTVVGGLTFGAVAVGLGLASAALSVAEGVLGGIIAYYRRQKVLTMEGNPDEILKAIEEYQLELRNATSKTVGGIRSTKQGFKKVLDLQSKVRVDVDTHISQSKTKASLTRRTTVGYHGDTGKPSMVKQTQSKVYTASSFELQQKQTTVVSSNRFGKNKSPNLEVFQRRTKVRQSSFTYKENKGVYISDGGDDIGVVASHTKQVSVEMSRSKYRQTTKSIKVTATRDFDMMTGKKRVSGENLNLGEEAKKLLLDYSPSEVPPNTILSKHEAGIPTTDPNTVYKYDAGTKQSYLERTLPLTPLPPPPYQFPKMIERVETMAALARKEERLAELLGISVAAERKVEANLAEGGSVAQLEALHATMEQSLARHRAALAAKKARVLTGEQLAMKMAEDDKKLKGNADKALQSEEVRGVAEITSNSFLAGIVRGGAGLLKAGAAVVNFVGGLLGKKEPVVDTKAVDKVVQLFEMAPKIKGNKNKLGEQRDIGKTGEGAMKPVQVNKRKIGDTEQKTNAAQGGTDAFRQDVDQVRQDNVIFLAQQKAYVDRVRKELQEVRAARAAQTEAYNQEMSAMQLWAAEHYQVRQLNLAVMASSHQLPNTQELDAGTRGKVQEAERGIDAMIARIGTYQQSLGRLVGEGLSHVQAETGRPASPAFSSVMGAVVTRFRVKVGQHLSTLNGMKQSLATVNAQELPAALEAVSKTLRAIELAVERLHAAYARALEELVQKAVEENIAAQGEEEPQAQAG